MSASPKPIIRSFSNGEDFVVVRNNDVGLQGM